MSLLRIACFLSVSVQADETMEWKVIKPDVFAAIMDFFTSGLPVVNEDSAPSPDTGKDFNQLQGKH